MKPAIAMMVMLLWLSMAAACGGSDDESAQPHGSDYETTPASLCDFESSCEHEFEKSTLCRQTLDDALAKGLLDQATADACASCLRTKSCAGIDQCYSADPSCQSVRAGLEAALAD